MSIPFPAYSTSYYVPNTKPFRVSNGLEQNRFEFAQRQEALIRKNWTYFLGVNVPITGLISAVTYGITRRYNLEIQAIQDFSKLCQLQKSLNSQLDQLARSGFGQSQLGSHWGFMQLRQLKMKVTAGAEPAELRQTLKMLAPEMNQNGLLKRILADTEQYIQAYDRLLASPVRLRALAKIPVFPRLLQMSPAQVEGLVQSKPQQFLKNLFQLSFTDLEQFGPGFFSKISADLAKASQRRSLLVTGVVGIGMLGSFWEILHAKNRKLRSS
jgi:hypothetical protein